MFDAFAPSKLHGNVKARTEWAIEQVKLAANASCNLEIDVMASFSGSLLFHTMYPWPQRPKGLVEAGFKELAKRWIPILDHCKDKGVEVCYEIHPEKTFTMELLMKGFKSYRQPLIRKNTI